MYNRIGLIGISLKIKKMGVFMKIFKRIIAVVLISLLAILILGIFTYKNYNDDDYARITALDYTAVVSDDSDAKVTITEILTFDVHATSSDNLFWELWRDLPEEFVDGVKVEYDVLSVVQILEDGTRLPWQESSKLYWWDNDYTDSSGSFGPGKWYHSEGPYDGEYNFECLLFYVDGLYRESIVFEIEYEMKNASLKYNDSSELYLSMFYGEDIQYLESVHGQILFPTDIMPKAGDYDAYTYGTNAHEFDFTESATLNPGYYTFDFNLDKEQLQFKDYNQYIEFALIAHGEDKQKFTQNAPNNYYSSDDMLPEIRAAQTTYEQLPEKALKDSQIILVSCLMGGIGLGVLALFINKQIKKKNPMYEPSIKIEYFRDIPSDLDANFARALVFSKQDKEDDLGDGFSAAMLSLAYKHYLELAQINPSKDWKSKNIKIVLLESTLENGRPALTPIEEQYYNLIKRHAVSNVINFSQFQQKISRDYQFTNSFVSKVKSSIPALGVSQGYFSKSNFRAPQKTMQGWSLAYAILALAVMIIGTILTWNTRIEFAYGAFFIFGGLTLLSALYLLIVSRKYILLTQFGQDEYAKWRGLYQFLNSETLMNEREVVELVIWEKYLIYATAFGISEKVIKALKIRVPDDMLRTSPILYSPIYRSRVFYHSSRSSFRNSTRSAAYTARSGGHGGFGGGGRGGGGGGGGH